MFREGIGVLFAVIAGLSLGGCSAKGVKSDYALDQSKNEGVVVVSVSHDDEGGRSTRAILYLNGSLLSGENAKRLNSLPEIAPDIYGKSDLEDGYGQVLALALPAGRHRFTSWQIAHGQIQLRPAEAPPSLEFELAPGEIKYIGNFHARLNYGKNVFGMTILGDGYFELRDRRDRDLGIIEGKYPQFKGKATVSLLSLGPWLSGDGIRRRADSPLFLLPVPVKK